MNVYKGIIRKKASDKEVMWITRLVLVLITLFAMLVATSGNQVIFTIVDFAWAGLGATFGPLMLFSLFYKKTTYPAAVAGMVTGGITVILWNFFIAPLGGVFAIYELLPAFILSSLVIFIVSKVTGTPSQEIIEDYEAVVNK
jgi:sodium/proline symporter